MFINQSPSGPHLVVIDPAIDLPDLHAANDLALASAVPVTYHAPGLYGPQSLADEAMDNACGVIILGSAASVNDGSPWQLELEAWLKPHLLRGLPAFGICYGHQLLAKLFGGTVGYLQAGRRSFKGLRRTVLDETLWGPAADLALVVAHGEGVLALPPDMTVYARSDLQVVEGLRHRHLPIWTLQAHPEANTAFLLLQGIELPADSQVLALGQQLVRRFIDYSIQLYAKETP